MHYPRRSATAFAIVCVIICCCCCDRGCRAQAPHQFLGSLWRQRFGLADNQSLTEKQFESVLTDLRIGSYYNATIGGCTAASVGSGNGTTTFASVDTCLTSGALVGAFGLNLSLGLTRENFSNLAVALVQQQLSGGCILSPSSEANETTEVMDSKWAYIYGTVSVTVISLLSCVGCILITCNRTPWFQHLLLFLVELAIGSLVGEALLHLLPTVMENGHEEGEGSGVVPPSFLKLVAAAGAICVLHAIDTGSSVSGLEGHSHNSAPNLMPIEAASGQTYSMSMADGEATAGPAGEMADAAEITAKPESTVPFSFVHKRVRLSELARSPKLCLRNPVRLCLFVMFSDALHNFGDGVAIGAAFAHGNSDGLRLSLSIGLHELAHELADFAVLLSCGFSVRAAVFINFVCTATCFLGLYIAIPLSESSTEAQIWILAVTAAMFLYIALVTMTNLVRDSYRPKSTTAFLVGNLGLIVGFLSVIAISMYEIFG